MIGKLARFLAVGTVMTLLVAGCTRTEVGGSAEGPGNKRLDVSITGLNTTEAFTGLFNSIGSTFTGLPMEPGARVTLHLRRDAIGFAGDSPAGLNVDGPSRGAFSLTGTYAGGTPGWVAVDSNERRYFIPIIQVLAVETDPSVPSPQPSTVPEP